ncbi:MAG: hypothetical protein ACE5LX_01470, partial [Nitrospinota bacterium]
SQPAEAGRAGAEEEAERKLRVASRAKNALTSSESPRDWEESARARTGRCVYLGSRKARGEALAYASRRNVCWARGEEERRFLRTVRYPFMEVAIDYQRTFCLARYSRCEIYKSAVAEG